MVSVAFFRFSDRVKAPPACLLEPVRKPKKRNRHHVPRTVASLDTRNPSRRKATASASADGVGEGKDLEVGPGGRAVVQRLLRDGLELRDHEGLEAAVRRRRGVRDETGGLVAEGGAVDAFAGC